MTEPTVVPTTSPTWVLYKPDPTDPLFFEPAGVGGQWAESADLEQAALDALAEHATGHPDWYVKVRNATGRMIAWAEWRDGHAVARLAGAYYETEA
jgi:hypothetical protein